MLVLKNFLRKPQRGFYKEYTLVRYKKYYSSERCVFQGFFMKCAADHCFLFCLLLLALCSEVAFPGLFIPSSGFFYFMKKESRRLPFYPLV
ncbi:hypothetical protein HQ47_07100 [Porphyromonas macacae]|uniref:Uncharacterized protein n=1 Tax=Porphyromonas macacae TaxID=28115 RepID=A0A0A2E8D1_9PORP|nr:hypothetical protein HQ47_07100 [Porphyromonas macacae]